MMICYIPMMEWNAKYNVFKIPNQENSTSDLFSSDKIRSIGVTDFMQMICSPIPVHKDLH